MIQNGFDICALHDNDGKFRNDDDGHQGRYVNKFTVGSDTDGT